MSFYNRVRSAGVPPALRVVAFQAAFAGRMPAVHNAGWKPALQWDPAYNDQMAQQTTIVIVNWNGERFLPNLLQSIRDSDASRTIVIDNSSTDRSLEILAGSAGIELVQNKVNLGFGAAANQGIRMSSTPYVLILNADIQALPASIDLLEEFLEKQHDAAVAAPQLLFPDKRIQPSCRSFPTINGLFLYFSYLDHLFPSRYRWKEDQHGKNTETDQPMGAALMFRRSVLEQVGFFDERFFMYMEEVDLCKRIKDAGWKVYYCPEAKMIHDAGGSTGQDWERSQRNFFESLIRYFHKHHATGVQTGMLKCTLAVALFLRSIVLLFAGRLRQSKFFLGMSSGIFSIHG